MENETLRQDVYRDFILGEFTEKQVRLVRLMREASDGGCQLCISQERHRTHNKRLELWHEKLMAEYLAQYI